MESQKNQDRLKNKYKSLLEDSEFINHAERTLPNKGTETKESNYRRRSVDSVKPTLKEYLSQQKSSLENAD